jgi:hypothetical protein
MSPRRHSADLRGRRVARAEDRWPALKHAADGAPAETTDDDLQLRGEPVPTFDFQFRTVKGAPSGRKIGEASPLRDLSDAIQHDR